MTNSCGSPRSPRPAWSHRRTRTPVVAGGPRPIGRPAYTRCATTLPVSLWRMGEHQGAVRVPGALRSRVHVADVDPYAAVVLRPGAAGCRSAAGATCAAADGAVTE